MLQIKFVRDLIIQVSLRYVEDVPIVDKAVKGNLSEPKDRATMREIQILLIGYARA